MSGDLPNNDSLIGLTVDSGRYEIVKLIGEGGMGRVFQARQVSMNRMVALKILRAQLAADAQLHARFQQEAMSVSRLRHPNTITVYDYGKTEDGYLFMAMELLGGRSLFSLLREEKRLPLPRVLHIMEQVCGAVAEAHEQGIVHRDLKPENIQIDKVGGDPDFAKVLDFGIAKIVHGDNEAPGGKTLTMAGAIFGTPHYMSPEQVHGMKIDHRTDVYSLGVILYEMVTGKPPFDGATPMAVMMAQASKPPPDPRAVEEAELTDAVAELIAGCLTKDREGRIPDVGTMIELIREARYELGEITGSCRVSYNSGLHRVGEDGDGGPRVSRPPAASRALRDSGGHAQPKRTPAPSIDTEADANPTPEHTGALATAPPASIHDDLDVPRGGGAAKWAALGFLMLGLGGGAYLAFSPGDAPEPPSAPAAMGAEPEVVKITGIAIAWTLESTPAGAEVYLGDEKLGVTPFTRKVPEGKTERLTFKAEGHEPRTYDIAGSGAPTQTLEVKLDPLVVDKAWLKVASEPAGAVVFHKGAEIGTTPFEWRPAASVDPAELKFAKDGFDDVIEKVALAAGGDAATEVKVELAASKTPRKRRWRPRKKKGQAGGSPTPEEPGLVEAPNEEDLPPPKPKPKPKPRPKPKPTPKPEPEKKYKKL